ncbi:MAG: TRAP transporter permease, partial [Clostridia bacterium]|nr:TRAP transporter permease [Clostridia bacterium]
TNTDIFFGIILIIALLEAARRATGWVMVLIAGVFLLYAFLGPYIPGILGHKGYALRRIVSQMYLSTEGIFGVPLGVSADYIFLFIFLTSMLERLGMGAFLLDLAMAIMGRFAGGPAKVAVVASGFMGSISGSAVANVVGTGSFTIPLMKRNGYTSHFAGAVEACASSGGQFMPPIMGAAAFIIAEFLAIPYISVVGAAVIPALLYYSTVLFGVHFEACRSGLRGLPKEELPSAIAVLKKGGHFLIPLGVLVFLLVVVQNSPIRAGFWAIMSMFVVSFFRRETWLTWEKFRDGCVASARNAVGVALACATAGIVVGTINLTGVGLKLSAFISILAGGNVWLAMILTGTVVIFLGMGLPTTAAYIVAGTMAAPALVELGLLPLGAHLFVFYFAIISAITPPVALAAYAAAGIAQSNPMRIALTSCRLGLAAFIIPFLFAQSPALLAQAAWLDVLLTTFSAFIGTAALAAGTIGFLFNNVSAIQRLLLVAGSLTMLHVSLVTDVVGLSLITVAVLLNLKSGKPGFAPTNETVQ